MIIPGAKHGCLHVGATGRHLVCAGYLRAVGLDRKESDSRLSIAYSGSTGVSVAGLIPSTSRDQPPARTLREGMIGLRRPSRATYTLSQQQIAAREN